MADLTDLDWWLGRNRGGVASSPGTLPPAIPGQTPRLPPPVSSPFSDVMGSPAFQLGYPLLASIASAAFPQRGTRAVAGLTAGLNTANYFNQLQQQQQALQKQENEKQRLGDVLKEYMKAEKFTTPQIQGSLPYGSTFTPEQVAKAPMLAEPGDAEATFSNTAAPTNKAPVIPESWHKRLGQALLDAGQPAAALKFIEAEKDKPLLNMRPGSVAYNQTTGQPEFSAPALPSPPQRPVYHTAGGSDVKSVYNPATKSWEETRTPLTAAPPRELTPEAKAELQARTKSHASADAERVARERRLSDAAKAAKDPKASEDKLTTMYQGLLRDRKESDMADNTAAVAQIDLILGDVRERLATVAKQKNQPQGGPKREKYDAQGNLIP